MINTLAIIIGNGLSITLIIILLFNLPYGFSHESLRSRIFTRVSIPIILGALFGIGSAVFDGMSGSFGRVMVTLCGSGGIIMPILVSVGFWLYVESTTIPSLKVIKGKIIVALLPVLAVLMLVIINLWTPIVFLVSDNNVYQRGPLGLVAYVVGPVYLVITLFHIAYLKSIKRGFLFLSLWGVIIPILVVSIIQIRSYGIIQAWIGFAIGMVALYIGMEKDLLYTDSMTRAFNRIYLDYIIREAQAKNTALGGIMTDIDHFKSINDNLGHHMGDKAIKKVAAILKKSADKNVNVIRIGGDEFLVLAYTDDEKYLDTLMERIRENIKAESNTADVPVELELSMGSAVYIPAKGSEAEWLSQMDEKMYKEKFAHHMERGIDRRQG